MDLLAGDHRLLGGHAGSFADAGQGARPPRKHWTPAAGSEPPPAGPCAPEAARSRIDARLRWPSGARGSPPSAPTAGWHPRDGAARPPRPPTVHRCATGPRSRRMTEPRRSGDRRDSPRNPRPRSEPHYAARPLPGRNVGKAARRCAAPVLPGITLGCPRPRNRVAVALGDLRGVEVVVAATVGPADVVEEHQRQLRPGRPLVDQPQLLGHGPVVVVAVQDHHVGHWNPGQRLDAGLTHQLQLRALLFQLQQARLGVGIDGQHRGVPVRGPEHRAAGSSRPRTSPRPQPPNGRPRRPGTG